MSTESPEIPSRSATGSGERRTVRKVVQIGLGFALVAVVFLFALPQFADFSAVWRLIREMTWLEVLTLTAVAAWNLVTYWLAEAAALPGSNLWQTMKVTLTATAVANTMPGGGALGVAVTYAMYTAYGFSRSAVSLNIVASGLWNNFAKLGLPILALSLLALTGEATSGRLTLALLGLLFLVTAVVIAVLILRSEMFARRCGDLAAAGTNVVRRALRRAEVGDWGHQFCAFRAEAIGLLRNRGLLLTAATLVSHLSLFAVLLLCLRHIGVADAEVSTLEALTVFSFVRLLTALPITPGGLGVVEVAMSAGMIAAGGNDAQTVAAILVYRALTYLLPVLLGAMAYARWRRGSAARAARLQEAASRSLAEKVAT